MSNNTGRIELIGTQKQKIPAVNASDGILDGKITDFHDADFTSGNVTLTTTEFQIHSVVRATNLSTARTLDLPDATVIGRLGIDNSAGTAVLTVSTGATDLLIPAGASIEVYLDGTTDGMKEYTPGGRGFLLLDIVTLRLIVTNDIDTSANHGGILTSDSTPALARENGATDKALRVNWVLGNTDEVQFPTVPMPPDLKETADVTVHLLAKMSGASDTPTIDVQVFDAIGDTEMGGATAALSNTLAELTVTIANANISGHPLGFFNIALVPGAHGTDALELYAAWIEYTRKSA